ncbi:hypothetical protein [Vibrio sp. PNB22_8_1]|uniref:hypothetical protein n=1 Tax=unclassified Vibrio TaxID=2614977 RepID=UPI00406A813B
MTRGKHAELNGDLDWASESYSECLYRQTQESRPVLDFLEMLFEIGAHYPVFETDTHCLYQQKDGSYTVKVLKN